MANAWNHTSWPPFGERRLLRRGLEAWAFRLAGVLDPSHYLRWCYFRRVVAGLPADPKRILDVGSGSGDYAIWLAHLFPKSQVVGIDLDRSRILRAQADAKLLGVHNVAFCEADICDYHGPQCDLVYSIDVLEHVPDIDAALRKIARLMATEAVGYIHVPTAREKPVPLSSHLAGFHAWAADEHVHGDMTATEVLTKIQGAGFELVTHWRTFGRWTGELATSLFALPWGNSPSRRAMQLAISPVCRALTQMDQWSSTRYAIGVVARKGQGAHRH